MKDLIVCVVFSIPCLIICWLGCGLAVEGFRYAGEHQTLVGWDTVIAMGLGLLGFYLEMGVLFLTGMFPFTTRRKR